MTAPDLSSDLERLLDSIAFRIADHLLDRLAPVIADELEARRSGPRRRDEAKVIALVAAAQARHGELSATRTAALLHLGKQTVLQAQSILRDAAVVVQNAETGIGGEGHPGNLTARPVES